MDHAASRLLKLKRFGEAEAAYQQALALLDEFEGMDAAAKAGYQASTYHQLGRVAEEQRQWDESRACYEKALAIFIEYDDRYRQASTYHGLGRVAEAQGQWDEARACYEKALAICIEYNDRYEQAGTYHQLGRVAEEQRQWDEALQYYLKDLAISHEYQDAGIGITLRSLYRLWQASGDAALPGAVGAALGISAAEAEALLQRAGQGQ